VLGVRQFFTGSSRNTVCGSRVKAKHAAARRAAGMVAPRYRLGPWPRRRRSVFAVHHLIIFSSRTSKLPQSASGWAFTGLACAAALPPLEMLCDIEADLLLKICEELPFQHVNSSCLVYMYRCRFCLCTFSHRRCITPSLQVMLLRCVCLSLRISIDSCLVPVLPPDEGSAPHDACGGGGVAVRLPTDARPRATLGSLLQRCCSPHLVMHSHSYGPDKSFVPALSSPPVLVGAALPGWGCARGSMSLGHATSRPRSFIIRDFLCCCAARQAPQLTSATGPNHALYSSRGICYGQSHSPLLPSAKHLTFSPPPFFSN
jgi:hypothetical protein